MTMKKTSFKTGLILFGLCTLTLAVKGGSMLLLFAGILPGLVYGFILTHRYDKNISGTKQFIFTLLSTVINWFSASFVIAAYSDKVLDAPYELICLSVLSFFFLKFLYDFYLQDKFTFLYSFFLPVVFGILAGLVSAFCIYFVVTILDINEVLHFFLFMGIFAIFPIWQYLFGLNLDLEKKAAANSV